MFPCLCRARCCGPAIPTPAKGNGEVNLTAIETAYKEFNITVEVIKGKPLDFPRIETAKSWITMGFDQDLNKAWAQAKAQTIKFLSEQRGVSAEQAGKLMPTVSDCRVSQVVNVKKGIHCLNPKNARDKEDMERPTKETSKYYVSHAKDADLNKAMNDASMGMIKLLESEKKIARLDAYGLASVAMDCRVGAISDTEKNVHCLMPKSIWVAANARRKHGRAAPARPFRVSDPWRCVSLSSPSWLALAAPGLAQDRIQVVTTTTDLRSLAEAVGGERIVAVSLVPANMDAEEYQPKPQDVLRLKNARMVVRVGLDYDLWLDRLLVQAGKPEISRGGPGYVDASFAIAVLELRGHERRPRRRPCPWQRQSALLARSQERRDHHRHDPRSAGAHRPGQCGRSTRPTGRHSWRGSRPS